MARKMDLKDVIANSFAVLAQTMLPIPIADVVEEKENGVTPPHDLSGIIAFSGPMEGMLTLHLNKKLAAQMTSLLLGFEVDESSPDVSDAVGEITNILAGNFKTELGQLTGKSIEISIPSVIRGQQYEVESLSGTKTNQYIFHTSDGDAFAIKLTVK